ncbi:Six-hairpin glycosidase-like protein [Dactylonectria estremocensis]|uniref:Six-hairpin glycosidase-like protein n=1 Tax=Dactylonectria estremocensis TaxID=1079267 RepID=A0A9P9F1Y5_9HYPO|nr:Six-hairpin glycosidase-like protein [Dactylonectria estremocensis]
MMHLLRQLFFGLTLIAPGQGRVLHQSKILEARYANLSVSKFIAAPEDKLTLAVANDSAAVVILDYQHVVEGFPAFEVVATEGDTSVFEITYGESRTSLDNYMKFNLSSHGALTLRSIGVAPSIDNTPISQLPGRFNSSNDKLNRIWSVGARTVQMTEIAKDSIPDFQEASSEGALVDSLAPQVHGSALAAQLLYYTMSFEVKPPVGGFGFTVLSDTLNAGIYISCDVDKQKITVHTGSTAEDEVLESVSLPANASLALGQWHSVKADVAMTDITVAIDGIQVLKMTQTSRFFGSFGFGASFGHRAIFRNLSVSSQGDEVFSYSLTDESFLADFFMGTNPLDTIVDGSRRDRIAYTGDLDVAGTAALVSTHGLDYILGSLDLLGSYQASPGFFIPTAKIQQKPLGEPLDVNITGLIGYSFNFLTAIAGTYMHTGDTDFAQKWAPKVREMLDWADSQCLENGLFNISDSSFGGDWNYYDPTQSGVVTKFNVLYAYALQECQSLLADGGINVAVYQERLEKLRSAIDSTLWSDKLQAYYLSEALPGGFSQDSNAIAILAGVNVNSSHSTQTILSTLAQLVKPAGPLAFSESIIAAGFQSYISPYASAYHLRAAMASNDSQSALTLLEKLWFPMADKENANYTGTFWETLDQDGRPGLGLVTSLCHGWAAGPTAELSKFVLGATPSQPGWTEFKIAPLTLGLTFSNGRLPSKKGNVDVSWQFDSDGLLTMIVEAPIGTKGTVMLPQPLLVTADESKFFVNGNEQASLEFEMVGGKRFHLTQSYK